ncbi:MAG: tetratricopeptide repeat protein, partial [Hyphomicrobiaceae bacterium]
MANGSVSRTRSSTIARLPAVAASLAVAMMLGACAGGGEIDLGLADKPQTTDIATASAEPRSESELEKATAYWAEQHTKNPRDAKAAVSYAQNLKALGRKSQALAALQAGYVHSPTDRPLLSEYGRLALELGQVSTAAQLLERADDAAKPDWRVVSARGTVLAKQGQYKDAITLYERALALSPSQASVMNNLAMAYTMDGQAARGEELLRQAQA